MDTIWIVKSETEEYGTVYLPKYAGKTENETRGRLQDACRRDDSLEGDTVDEWLGELGWEIVNVAIDNLPTAGPVREICSECGRVSPVGFWVPDRVWSKVMPDDRQHDVMCIMCFARLADQKMVQWDEEIEFFPVSKKTHREQVYSEYE